MSTPDLDAIQARADAARSYASRVHIQESADDVPALLALVREQQARIGRVEALHKPVSIYTMDEHGHINSDDESTFVRDICGTCSDSSATENLDDGNYDLAGEYGEVGWPCPTTAALTATDAS